ncbi:transcription termination factor 5, mitochondrial-like isoform X2 [Daktulosphaira vitifoliae]|nr:transcription termination factor 5, mitochondrial-like isoform X2 [Daktulosphaira vitifoliae]
MLWKLLRFRMTGAIFKPRIIQFCDIKNMNEELIIVLQEKLGLSVDKSRKIIKRNPSILKSTPVTLSNKISLMLDFGFTKDEIIKTPKVVTMHKNTIKNYIMLLEEGGFNKKKICPFVLIRFKYIIRKSIKSLKTDKFIQKNIDVRYHMLSFLQFPISQYPVGKCDELLSWSQVQNDVFELYLQWKLKLDSESVKRAVNLYNRLNNKSFRQTEKVIAILQNQLEFSIEKIRNNPYLLHSDPDNIVNILNNCKELCGKETKNILSKFPIITLSNYENIKIIQKHLKNFGIPESFTSKVPRIYTLSPQTVNKRLCYIRETPELVPFMTNLHVARLIFYKKQVNQRLKYLQNKNCVCVHLLTSNSEQFDKFNNNGNDKVYSNDIMVYLTLELKESKKNLRDMLARHPYWHYVSLMSIRQTCTFLKRHNFTDKQICHSIQVVLYPKEKISKALQDVENMKDIYYLRDSRGLIKSEFLLPLILYSLEINHHFSGDGVWSTANKDKQLNSSASLKHSYGDNEELDHVPTVISTIIE